MSTIKNYCILKILVILLVSGIQLVLIYKFMTGKGTRISGISFSSDDTFRF